MDIRLGLILEGACRIAGYDPEIQGIPGRWRVMAAIAVNRGLRAIYAEKFPIMRRIEFRRFRPTWKRNLPWNIGNECYLAATDHYYRLENGDGSMQPDAEGSGWHELGMNEVAAFIAFEQPWEKTAMDPGGVDVADFAYEVDPKYFPSATPIKGCKWFQDSVLLPANGPTGVYCRFVPKAPRVDFSEWVEDSSYTAGSCVYVTSEKECYVAMSDVAPGLGQPSAHPEVWNRLRIPDDFETYLVELAAANLITEDQGRYQTMAQAEKDFNELQVKFCEGSGDTKIRTGRFRR